MQHPFGVRADGSLRALLLYSPVSLMSGEGRGTKQATLCYTVWVVPIVLLHYTMTSQKEFDMKQVLITLLLAVCLIAPTIADASAAPWRKRASYDYEIQMYYITHPDGTRWYYVCRYNKNGGNCGWKKG